MSLPALSVPARRARRLAGCRRTARSTAASRVVRLLRVATVAIGLCAGVPRAFAAPSPSLFDTVVEG